MIKSLLFLRESLYLHSVLEQRWLGGWMNGWMVDRKFIRIPILLTSEVTDISQNFEESRHMSMMSIRDHLDMLS